MFVLKCKSQHVMNQQLASYLEKSNVIIIDIGTNESRFGFAGDENSQFSLPSNIVNYQKPSVKRSVSSTAENQTTTIVGDLKPWRYNEVEISPLVKDFNVRNWEGVERMILQAMDDWLCVKSDDNPVIVVEPPFAKKSRREKFTELLFEKLKVPGLMMYKDAALTCFARGRTSGMVVDMGEDYIRCCGVIDGYIARENISYQRFGGARIRDLYLDRCLHPFLQGQKETKARGILPRGVMSMSPSGKLCLYNAIAKEMNEKLSSVTENPYAQLDSTSSPSQQFLLPDGRAVTVGAEINTIPELLFYPTSLNDPSLLSLPLLIANQLTNSSSETSRDIASAVMLTGGGSAMKGLEKRLTRELSVMSKGAAQVVTTPETETRTGSYLGASILASLGSFAELIVTRAEYEEFGLDAVERKCP